MWGFGLAVGTDSSTVNNESEASWLLVRRHPFRIEEFSDTAFVNRLKSSWLVDHLPFGSGHYWVGLNVS